MADKIVNTGCWKIIAILEFRAGRKQLSFSAVPSSWLVANNTAVLWPNNQQETLRRDLTSTPKNGWKKYKCVLKKDNLLSFDEALLWEQEFFEAPDTDAEESLKIDKNYEIITEYVSDGSVSSNNNMEKYNNMFLIPSSQTECTEISQGTGEDLNLDTGEDLNLNVSIIDQFVQLTTDNKTFIEQVSNFQEKQIKMMEKINTEYVQIKTMLDNIYSLLKNDKIKDNKKSSVENIEIEENYLKVFNFPLKSIADLTECNNKIKSEDLFKKYLISKYNKFGGVDGTKKGEKLAPTIATVFFTNELLTFTSWTGISRTAGLGKKIAFQLYDGILDVFYEIIHSAHDRWTRDDNTSFFRDKLLKHSKQRSIAFNNKFNKNNETLQKPNTDENESGGSSVMENNGESDLDYEKLN